MPFLIFACAVCVFFSFFFYVYVFTHPEPPRSCKKQSNWKESVTGSTPQSPRTPSQNPPSSTLTSICRPRARAARPMGPSHRRRPAAASHPPRPPPRRLPRRPAAARRRLRRQWSRKSRGLSMRALIQRTVLISARLKMNRLRQIKPQLPQRQHRVRLLTLVFFSFFFFTQYSFHSFSIFCMAIFLPNIFYHLLPQYVKQD